MPASRFGSKLQLKQPTPYNGEARAHIYETWTFETNNYFTIAGYPEHINVRLISSYLSGKASKWYMNFVAPNPDKWTMAKIGRELFEYCFPEDIR
jgi:hypothetical protein